MNSSLFRLLPLLLSLLLATAASRAQDAAAQSDKPSSGLTISATINTDDDAKANPHASPTAAPATPPVTEPELRALGNDTASDSQAQAPASALTESTSTSTKTATSAESEQSVVPATVAKDVKDPAPKAEKPAKAKKGKGVHRGGHQGEPFTQIVIKEGDTAPEAVSILGSTNVAGEVLADAVSILGPNIITGKVGGNAVAILNDLDINGEVNGDAVCILGNVKFGPKAHIRGQVVSVLGSVDRNPDAIIDGAMNVVAAQLPGGMDFGGFGTWFKECLGKGRLLGFHSGLGMFWAFALCITLFQLLIALLFSKKVNHCCQLMEERPGSSLLCAALTLLLTPLLVILLLITGIGVLLVPFILIGMFFVGVFGRVVIQASIGRLFTARQNEGPLANAALSTLIGSVVVLLLYTVPVVGIMLHPLLGFLGTGVVVYALVRYYRASRETNHATPTPTPALMAKAPIVPPVIPAPTLAEPDLMAAPVTPVADTAAQPVAAQPETEEELPLTALPRATFGIRMLALVIDFVLIAMVTNFGSNLLPNFLHLGHGPGTYFLLLATYGALLWKFRGATIGDIIFGLQVIRSDDRPLDWTTCIVRALGCLLSGFAVGIGFLWIAIDRDREAWHDKIAGTAVVVVPKKRALV